MRGRIDNRAGLDEIERRIATYVGFKSDILRRVATVADDIDVESAAGTRPRNQPGVDSPIRRWTTRTDDDVGNALVEAAAIELDVLTFHQERINQELYLRTADQPDTIDCMVSLIGYSPSPAVTASTVIAFEIEPDRTVSVAPWSRLQSVPQDGELPQSFETVEELTAFGAASRLRPEPPTTPIRFRGRSSTLRVTSAAGLSRGDEVLAGPPGLARQRTIGAVVRDGDTTVIELDDDVTVTPTTAIWPIVARASAYGSDMPATLDTSVITGTDATWTAATLDRPSAVGTAGGLIVSPPVDVTADNVAIRASGVGWSVSTVLSMTTAAHGTGPYERQVTVVERALARFVTTDRVSLKRNGVGRSVIATPAASGSSGGITAPRRSTSTTSTRRPQRIVRTARRVVRVPAARGQPRRGTPSVRVKSRRATPSQTPAFVAGATALLLGRAVPLARNERSATFVTGTSTFGFEGGGADLLEPGRRIAIRDTTGAFAAEVTEIRRGPALTEVDFRPALARAFDAQTTELLGNVTSARHGERSANQVLGDGDPTLERQSFPLRRTPLAWHYDGSSPLGISPDIEVRAGGVRWDWVDRAPNEDPRAPRFVIERDGEDAVASVGSPAGGQPAPRGVRNVIADYRVGGGTEGNVGAETITTALDRPPALVSITNPIAADGGTDADTAEEVRFAAPRSLRSFGRIISLPDVAHAARVFPAVAKAASTWTWANGIQVLHLTVAGTDGATLLDETLVELRRFLDGQRDDRRPLRIHNYEPVMVELTIDVDVDERAVANQLAEEIRATLRESFAFDNLQLGQSIDASTLSMHLHRIEAVLGVKWTRLQRTTDRTTRTIRTLPRAGRTFLASRTVIPLPDPMPRAAIRRATPRGSYAVRPAELAVLDLKPRDVRLRFVTRPQVTS